jgi:hypothetical protein
VIRFVEVTNDFNKTELQAELNDINAELAETDNRKKIAIFGSDGANDLALYNKTLQNQADEIADVLDYWDYDIQAISMDEITSSYITPISVESFCAEDSGFEAVKSLDDDILTRWQDSTNHMHEIIYRIKVPSYPKKVIGFQIRTDGADRSLLTNIEARVANSENGLDKDTNILISGASLTVNAAWNQVGFTKKQTGELFKLTFDSQDTGNVGSIREIQVLVEPNKNL